jgi:hypothetical protein
MNFSSWHVMLAGPFQLSVRVGTRLGAGIALRNLPPPVWGWGRLGRIAETILEPNGQIDIRGEARISAAQPGLAGPVKLGFLQTLTRCTRLAHYGPTRHTRIHTFSRAHPRYPVKDGEGHPWYNEGNSQAPHAVTQFESAALAKYVMGNGFISPFVQVYDKPKFSFPASIQGNPLQEAQQEDWFVTCLALRYHQRFYGLYSLVWKVRASVSGANPPTGTISIVGQGPLAPPHNLPHNLVLQGASANRSEQLLLNGAAL